MKLISFVLPIIAIAILGLYLRAHWDDVKPLLNAHPQWTIPVIGLMVIRILPRSQAAAAAFAALGKPVALADAAAIAVIANGANQFLPLQGGMAFRAVFFRRVYSISFSEFAGTFLAIQLLAASLTSAIALLGLVTLPVNSAMGIAMGSAAGIFVATMATFLTLPLPKRPRFLNRYLRKAHEGFGALRRDRKALRDVLFNLGVLRVVEGVSYWCACQSLGIELSLWNSMLVTSIVAMAGLIQITPDNLGIREALFALLATSFSLTPIECLTAALILRLAAAIRSLALAPLALIWLKSRHDLRTEVHIPLQEEQDTSAFTKSK